MTTAIGPPRDDDLEGRANDLEGRANEAERRLLLTLDVLADRKRYLRASLHRARAKLQSGVTILSMFLLVSVAMLGVLSLTRPREARWRRRR